MALYAGFLLGTLFCALAPNYHTLVAARIATGAFGGILGGMAMAIIGDVFPEHRRGRATGSLMTGFALASVAGVPFGLYLGTNYGWHVPFIVLAIGGLPALVLAPFALPPLDAHVGKSHAHPLRSLVETFSHANHLNAFALIVTLMIGSFTVFPVPQPVPRGERRHDRAAAAAGLHRRRRAHALRRADHRPAGRPLWQADGLSASIVPVSALLLLVITHLPPVPVARRRRRVRRADGLQRRPHDRRDGDGHQQRRAAPPRRIPQRELLGAARRQRLRRVPRRPDRHAIGRRQDRALRHRRLDRRRRRRSPACGSPAACASSATSRHRRPKRSASPPRPKPPPTPANRYHPQRRVRCVIALARAA